MPDSVFRAGATALVTGAGSGIGFAIARLCRSQNMNLVLVDIHADHLGRAQEILDGESGIGRPKILTHIMDVSEISSWEYLRDEVLQAFPKGVDLLVLNAGTMRKGEDNKSPWTDLEYFNRIFATNVNGVLNGIATFLPVIMAEGELPVREPRAIVITGSKQGITNPPGGKNPAYNASKAAVKAIAEHLAHDIRSEPGETKVSVHLLVPGWTYSGMAGHAGPVANEAALAKESREAWLPGQVAEYLYEKMKIGQFYIICPDGEVTEELDKARMKWAMEDVIERRPPLSRWEIHWEGKARALCS
ncbi:hypothetical protein FQN57_004532 [Myotisia sp. PD_48]|nr:hypothetical protein FQN57_004532 [Myotisia sp. PD_48]